MNLLKNGNFSLPAASPTLLIGTGHAGNSSAPNWMIWNNAAPPDVCAYTSTAIITLKDVVGPLPTSDSTQPYCFGIHYFREILQHVPGTTQVIEVCTNGGFNGLFQLFGGEHQRTRSSAWVFVLRGHAGIGTGHGGVTIIDKASTKLYEWEHLQAPNGGSPATEFIVYSTNNDVDGAWFFVANADVEPM